jgi:hypothetical protein
MKKGTILILLSCLLIGCNVSPLSPANRQKISGDVGEIRSNQNGIMGEIAALKSRLDIIARDVDNLQSGLINSNNKNFGIQIFQGDGGLAIGLAVVAMLAAATIVYKMKAEKYKKTAELFGRQIKKMNNEDVENEIFSAALMNKVEKNVYEILR